MFIISPLLPITHHPLSNDPKFNPFFHKTNIKYFCMVKRDNNCFYTSLSYSLLKMAHTIDKNKVNTLLNKLSEYRPDFEKYNGSTVAFDDLFTQFEEMLKEPDMYKKVVDESGDYLNIQDYNERLEKYAKDEDQYLYNYMIAFHKMIISTHLKKHEDQYKDIIGNVQDYCKANVDVFNRDAGDVEISVTSNVYEIKIRVHHVESGYVQDYGDWEKCIDIFYTPGHFEPVFEYIN